jgi:hypothetical protein
MDERKPADALQPPDVPEPAQESEPMEAREPVDMLMQEELRGERCEAKCPTCDEGFCEKDPHHDGEHWCDLCAKGFQAF